MALDLRVNELQAHLRSTHARWRAEVTNLSHLSEPEKLRRLGANPPRGAAGLSAREAKAVKLTAIAPDAIRVGTARWDWRNVNGQNYVTSVKDQGSCGSCVAFGTIATVETTMRVEQQTPTFPIDLSEAQLFYCEARAQGRNCSNGWWPDKALQCIADPGVADDACYPYTAGDQNCTNLCANWQQRVTKIANFHSIGDHQAMKSWLSSRGALSTCFSVYDDFYSYRSGVYQHVMGDLAGGHCVSVVGFDDLAQCWICKNSWGPAWGDGGFFEIGYGQCGIDAEMWAVDGVLGPKVTLGDTSYHTPALAAFANYLALAWTGTDNPSHLNVMVSVDGYHFGNKVTLGETSFDGPGLAAGGGKLFLAWTGTDAQHHLNVVSSSNGHDFGNKVTLGDTASFGPALAFGNGRLFLAWVGTDSHRSINIMSSNDGVHWENKVTLGENSDSAVALCWAGNLLYLVWQGTDSGSHLNLLQSADGKTWSNKITLGDTSNVAPALLQSAQLILAWTGTDSRHSLNTMVSSTGSHGFGDKVTFEDTAAAGLSLAPLGNSPYIAWAGTDSGHHLNVMRIPT